MNNEQQSYTFPKAEKMVSQKAIDQLFVEGKSFIAYPLRVVYHLEETETEFHPSVLISVSKKKFKRAVKRNRVKRLFREAYRLNKQPFVDLLTEKGMKMNIAFLYLKNELPTYTEMEEAVQKAQRKLTEALNEQ